MNLAPAFRKTEPPIRRRGRRFETCSGEAFQMNWSFVDAEEPNGGAQHMARFAIVCHYRGAFHIEFFTNACQENLCVGMVWGFAAPGVSDIVLTGNMKSAVICRNLEAGWCGTSSMGRSLPRSGSEPGSATLPPLYQGRGRSAHTVSEE